jgi:hypothetical protein
MVMVVPFVAVVADAVRKILTVADAVGAEETIFDARPTPKFETALITIW